MRFLTGKDYPELCDTCRHMVDMAVDLVVEGPDTDDEEAPLNFVYDHHLFCGGDHCAVKEQVRLEARQQERADMAARSEPPCRRYPSSDVRVPSEFSLNVGP